MLRHWSNEDGRSASGCLLPWAPGMLQVAAKMLNGARALVEVRMPKMASGCVWVVRAREVEFEASLQCAMINQSSCCDR